MNRVLKSKRRACNLRLYRLGDGNTQTDLLPQQQLARDKRDRSYCAPPAIFLNAQIGITYDYTPAAVAAVPEPSRQARWDSACQLVSGFDLDFRDVGNRTTLGIQCLTSKVRQNSPLTRNGYFGASPSLGADLSTRLLMSPSALTK